jgi:hypothetical protein
MDLLDAAYNGKKFKVDLVDKSLWINKKQIIEKGIIIDEQNKSKELICVNDSNEFGYYIPLNEEPWKWIEFLYETYKHSVPRENTNSRSCFKALSVDELKDGELAYNADRDYMIAILEGYILLGSLQGWIKWEYGNHWFWQSEHDKDLVVLRNFVE